jgi:hypothetical protein
MRRSASILLLAAAAVLAVSCAKKQDLAPAAEAPAAPPPAATAPSSNFGDTPVTSAESPKTVEKDKVEGGDETKAGLPGGSTGEKEDSTFTRVEDAEAALAKADQEIQGLVPAVHGSAPVAGPKKPASKPASSATPLARGEPRCENACKAMESLRRAADAVCRLTSKTDDHCKKAQKLVKTNEARVAVCQCSGS